MDILNSPIVFLLPLAVMVFGSMYIRHISKKDKEK